MAFILDGTTGIATVDGSVSAPSQRGQDSNTGISYAADTIKFSTNGVERMSITNSGVVGAGGGKVVQVVEHTFTNETQSSLTQFIDLTGGSKTLTLTASDSSVLIIANLYTFNTRGYSGQGISLRIRKTVGGTTSTVFDPKDNGEMFQIDTSQLAGTSLRGMQTLISLDTPGNTSVTYTMQGEGYTANNSGGWGVNRTDNGDTATSKIIFMEIAA
tara:strand:+ start:175 stop:819 length:645 start_codon:yes stop_codon:yes gene_type:complete